MTAKIKNLSQKYIDFLDIVFWEDGGWSDLVEQLVERFHITPDYADKIIEAYIEI